MIIEVAERAQAAVNDLLAAVNAGTATSVELREVLGVTRSTAATVNAAQTAAAELIARRERHGDGGVEILASSAGLSQREAHSQVKTAQTLSKVPKLRDAVQSGDVPAANARNLADAITRTSSGAVADDDVLLAQASTMRPEVFARTAQRWIQAQQADNGASEHARQRAMRCLKIYESEDGMVNLRGQFDKITGQRISNRLRHTAAKLFNADKKLPQAERREFTQCMADALDHHTISRPSSVAHAASGDGSAAGKNAMGRDASGKSAVGKNAKSDSMGARSDNAPVSDNTVSNYNTVSCNSGGDNTVNESGEQGAVGGWVADITVLASVDDTTGELVAELSDGSRLPPAVLEEMSCNARWTGLIFDRYGDAIWRSRSRRTVTESQWQALLAIHGGCFHCGAPPAVCQAHHIIPYSQGGATSLENLIMVCWNCHHRIHHNNWRIETHPDNSYTLHPPDNTANQPRYGPAHADDYPPEPPNRTRRDWAQRSRVRTGRASRASRGRASNQGGEPNANARDPNARDPNARDPSRNRESRESQPKARDPDPATLW